MQFNDVANGQGLVQDTYFRVGLDATTGPTSYPIEDVTRNINTSLDEVLSLIIQADGRWEFDDANFLTLPIGTTQVNSGQQDYTFPNRYLDIRRMELLLPSGKTIKLKPFDQTDLPEGVSLTEYQNSLGIPESYDKMGESVFLYPKPNFTLPASLKAYFRRKMENFLITDTVKEPGFRENLHAYCSISAAYDYACLKSLPQEAKLRDLKAQYAENIKTAYSLRSRDEKGKIRPKIEVKI